MTDWPAIAGFGVAVNDAVGGPLPIDSGRVVESVPLPLSVTRSPIVSSAAGAYVRVVVAVVPPSVS